MVKYISFVHKTPYRFQICKILVSLQVLYENQVFYEKRFHIMQLNVEDFHEQYLVYLFGSLTDVFNKLQLF